MTAGLLGSVWDDGALMLALADCIGNVDFVGTRLLAAETDGIVGTPELACLESAG